jgi:hypothetical protein
VNAGLSVREGIRVCVCMRTCLLLTPRASELCVLYLAIRADFPTYLIPGSFFPFRTYSF